MKMISRSFCPDFDIDALDTGWINPELRQLAVPIGSIRVDADNWRRHGGPESYDIMAIRRSFAEHGQQKPVVVNAEGELRAGSGSHIAAVAEGHDCIAAVMYDADDTTLRRFGFMDNRSAELSEWDLPLIGSFIDDPAFNDIFESMRVDELFESMDNIADSAGEQDVHGGIGVQSGAAADGVNINVTFVDRKRPAVDLKSPYAYYGAKSMVADAILARLDGAGGSYDPAFVFVESFYGGGSVFLARRRQPGIKGHEIVNDIDPFISNFWRAVQADPDAVAGYADWIKDETDYHARELWCMNRKFEPGFYERMVTDPEFYDAKLAGWWVWGMALHYGFRFASGHEGHTALDSDGKLVDVTRKEKNAGRRTVSMKRPAVCVSHGIDSRRIIYAADNALAEKLGVEAGDIGKFAGESDRRRAGLLVFMRRLQDRLRGVTVLCGDWSKSVQPVIESFGDKPIAVMLDPPYAAGTGRTSIVYGEDDLSVSAAVRDWAVEHGVDKRYRIALCGYIGEHEMPSDWEVVRWQSRSWDSRSHGKENAKKECIWFSPGCLKPGG